MPAGNLKPFSGRVRWKQIVQTQAIRPHLFRSLSETCDIHANISFSRKGNLAKGQKNLARRDDKATT